MRVCVHMCVCMCVCVHVCMFVCEYLFLFLSFGGRTITSLHFAANIDGLAGEEEELAKVVERLDKASTTCSMEISAEKTNLMTNNTSGINIEIKENGQKLRLSQASST